jgi:rare lipoprotein A
MGFDFVLWSWLTFALPIQQTALEKQAALSEKKEIKRELKTGIASFYHDKFVGRKTATGEVFDNGNYTAASNHFKLGTYVKVTNQSNGKVVYVKVNDRMGHQTRMIDLAEVAAKDLKFIRRGTTKVKIEPVSVEEGRKQVLAQKTADNATPANQL